MATISIDTGLATTADYSPIRNPRDSGSKLGECVMPGYHKKSKNKKKEKIIQKERINVLWIVMNKFI